MEKYIKKIFLVLILPAFLSCSDESVDNQINSSTDGHLIAIKESFDPDTNVPERFNYYELDDDEITKITYVGAAYALNSFSNGVITLEEVFNSSNQLTNSRSFTYDGMGRLIQITSNVHEGNTSNVATTRLFEHVGNEIFSTDTGYLPDGNIQYISEPNVFTLDSNNQIIKFQEGASSAMWRATYINGNLATIDVSGYANKDGSGSFTYLNKIASGAYQREQYKFGSQWKLNIMLTSQVGGYSFKQLAELGTNYLSSYSYLGPDGTENIFTTKSYQFNDVGQLIRQTEIKRLYINTSVRDISYEYEILN